MVRVTFKVVDMARRTVDVTIYILPDTVELWFADRLRAVLDREALRNWLAGVEGVIIADDVTWARGGGQVGLTLAPEVPWWPLAPDTLAVLRQRV